MKGAVKSESIPQTNFDICKKIGILQGLRETQWHYKQTVAINKVVGDKSYRKKRCGNDARVAVRRCWVVVT